MQYAVNGNQFALTINGQTFYYAKNGATPDPPQQLMLIAVLLPIQTDRIRQHRTGTCWKVVLCKR